MEKVEGYKVTQVTREQLNERLGDKVKYRIGGLGIYDTLDEALKAKNDLARAILKGVDLS